MVVGSVESVVQGHAEHQRGLGAPDHGEEEEPDEMAVVVVTHAVVDPRTMVIHLLHASTAFPAI